MRLLEIEQTVKAHFYKRYPGVSIHSCDISVFVESGMLVAYAEITGWDNKPGEPFETAFSIDL